MNERDRTTPAFLGLFDFSFSTFITVTAIKILYVIGMIIAAVGALVLLGTGVSSLRYDFASGLLTMIAAPLYFFVVLIVFRIWCEMLIVVFRGVEFLRIIAERDAPQTQPSDQGWSDRQDSPGG